MATLPWQDAYSSSDAEISSHDILIMSSLTPQARAKLPEQSETQFQKSYESAYSVDSVVPSRMSVSTSQRDSYASGQSQYTIEYRPLSFEKRLFMSKVYMRNSKNVMIKELSEADLFSKRKDTATETDQTVTN